MKKNQPTPTRDEQAATAKNREWNGEQLSLFCNDKETQSMFDTDPAFTLTETTAAIQETK